MTNEEKFILLVLSGLSKKTLFPDGEVPKINSAYLIRVLVKNKIVRRFAYEILSEENSYQYLPKDFMRWCHKILLLWENEHRQYIVVFEMVKSILNEINIDYWLLKGLSLNHSDVPRDIGDIDILIHEDNLILVDKNFRKLGWEYVADKRKTNLKKEEKNGNLHLLKTWSNQFEYRDPESGYLLEIHTNLFERDRIYSFSTDQIWEECSSIMDAGVVDDSLGCKVLSVEDRFLLIALHNAFRRSACRGTYIYRYVFDMYELLKYNDIDWNLLYERALSTNTNGFLLYSLEMLDYFYPGHLSSEFLLKISKSLSIGKKFIKSIQHKCFYSFMDSKHFPMFLYRLFVPFIYNGKYSEKLKSLLILPRLFRSFSSMSNLYNLPRNSPLLLFVYLLEPFRLFFVLYKKRYSSYR